MTTLPFLGRCIGEYTVPKVISELLVSLDMMAAGTQSPGYFGYLGPEFGNALQNSKSEPHRTLMGRKTYEVLNSVPDEARDDGWRKTTEEPGYLFSRQLDEAEWPGLQLVKTEMVEFVRELKVDDGPQLRVLGSLSIARQLAKAKLLDLVRLYVCPLALPETGKEPVFAGWGDTAFSLCAWERLDDRVLRLDYRPDGSPPKS
jgi:dihydrofolate reductase